MPPAGSLGYPCATPVQWVGTLPTLQPYCSFHAPVCLCQPQMHSLPTLVPTLLLPDNGRALGVYLSKMNALHSYGCSTTCATSIVSFAKDSARSQLHTPCCCRCLCNALHRGRGVMLLSVGTVCGHSVEALWASWVKM